MFRRPVVGIILFCLALLPSPAPSQTDPSAAAMALFQQQRYAEALPLFQQAAYSQPDKPLLLYYLAYCQEKTGDLKGAVLNFYRVDSLKASPVIRSHADKEKDKLSLEDQAWVEDQLQPRPTPTPGAVQPALDPSLPAPPPGSAGAGYQASPVLGPVEFLSGRFGFRANLGFDFWNMPDLDSEDKEFFDFVQSQKPSHSGITYDKTTPLGGLFMEGGFFGALEDGEIGAKFDYYFTNHYLYKSSDPYHPAYFETHSVDFDSFGGSAYGRLSFKIGPGARYYLEPSLGVQTLHMIFNIHYEGTSGNPSGASYGFEADGTSLAAGLGMGWEFLIGKRFSFAFGGGYNYARFNNLKGRFEDNSFPSRNNIPGQAVMVRDPANGERYIWFRPDDPSLNYHFYGSSISNFDLQPMVLDLSAVRFTTSFSVLF